MTTNGQLNFTTALDDLSVYAVSITSQPTTPNQQCLITLGNESGSLAGSDVVVTIECITTQYTVGVDVSGLASGNTLGLDNSGEGLTVSSNGLSNFASGLDDLSGYSVSITSQPSSPNQTCENTSANQVGAISGDDVTISIECTTNRYFIGGTVNGLLDNNFMMIGNNTDELIISSDGAFLFSMPLIDEENYDVQILLEPENPIQPCTLLNNTGMLDGNDIVDIEINCEVGDDLIYSGGFEEVPAK
ncbi:MAG: hypothetical protein JKY19_06865 [Alcanivoracaceae bacterium]|nr:hypothetical protein [Alcanivoracaceae bacterium]